MTKVKFETNRNILKNGTADKRTISVLLKLSFNISFIAQGLRPQTPTVAPPLAGLSMKSPVAYNNNTHYLHDQTK